MASLPNRQPAGSASGGQFAAHIGAEQEGARTDEAFIRDGWVPVTTETVEWRPTIPPEALTRAQRETYKGPYERAIVPTIADKNPYVSADVANLANEASLAITRFDTELGAEVAPFSAILLRTESASSSQIENLTSGAKQIALAELGSQEKRNATEIVGNVAAMQAALRLSNRVDTGAILAMHQALMERHDPDIAGKWRAQPVWVGGSSIGPHGAHYVGPSEESVPALMNDLVQFSRRTDIPALTMAAIAHAQFETVHPFADGNGRVGRALIQSMMRGNGLTKNVTVPVSSGLLTDTRSYFDSLDEYQNGNVSPIVERMSNAALSAIRNGKLLVADLHRVRADWDKRLRVRRGSSARKLVEVLFRQPVIDSRTAAVELDMSPTNVRRAIQPLVDAGILNEFTGFNRNRMWHAKDVTGALDEFARRSIRPSV